MTSASTPTEPTGRGLALLAVLMAAILVTVTASDMVNLMLPTIGAESGPPRPNSPGSSPASC